jgi:pimeloyl-ACP methyl ester carboxylesterase
VKVRDHGIAGGTVPVPQIQAVVQVGPVEVAYRRAGAGAPVVLLHDGEHGAALAAALFDVLATRFRVIAPDAPPAAAAGVTLARWLRGLIDGLGLERPSIVAAEEVGVAVLAFAMDDPDRVDRLAILRCAGVDLTRELDPVVDVLFGSGHPLMVLPVDAAWGGTVPAAAAAPLVEFLGAGG